MSSDEAQAAMSEQDEFVQYVLCNLPIRKKLTHLVFSLLMADPLMSVENLVEISIVMSRRLEPHERAAVAWQMQQAIAELEAVWQ